MLQVMEQQWEIFVADEKIGNIQKKIPLYLTNEALPSVLQWIEGQNILATYTKQQWLRHTQEVLFLNEAIYPIQLIDEQFEFTVKGNTYRLREEMNAWLVECEGVIVTSVYVTQENIHFENELHAPLVQLISLLISSTQV